MSSDMFKAAIALTTVAVGAYFFASSLATSEEGLPKLKGTKGSSTVVVKKITTTPSNIQIVEVLGADLSSEVISALSARSSDKYVIGIDVGGTNTRVALMFSEDTINDYFILAKFKSNSTITLVSGVKKIADALKEILKNPAEAGCLAAAGPITNQNQVVVTNYHGEKNLGVADLDDFIFPHRNSIFINDLEGTCAGIQAVNQYGELSKYFSLLWGPNSKVKADLDPHHNLVLAMGTGLGTAALISNFTTSHHTILPMEGGHVYVTELGEKNQKYSRERDMIHFISDKLYGGSHTIEFEDICSGRGLRYVYEFLTGKPNVNAEEIAALALQGDENSLEAFRIHYRFLLRNAQNLSVALQTKRVFLAGGNQVNNKAILDIITPDLQQEFLNHVKTDWLKPVYVFTQIQDENFNILGALYMAKIVE